MIKKADESLVTLRTGERVRFRVLVVVYNEEWDSRDVVLTTPSSNLRANLRGSFVTIKEDAEEIFVASRQTEILLGDPHQNVDERNILPVLVLSLEQRRVAEVGGHSSSPREQNQLVGFQRVRPPFPVSEHRSILSTLLDQVARPAAPSPAASAVRLHGLAARVGVRVDLEGFPVNGDRTIHLSDSFLQALLSDVTPGSC